MDQERLFDSAHTALVVIDLQQGIVTMPVAPYTAAMVIANASRMADAFRAIGAPVFLVHVGPSSDGKDSLSPRVDHQVQRPDRPANWMEFVPEIGPKKGDFLITKRQWGAFYGTELDLQLRRRGIRTIVLCGIATNMGVESTARFAYEYGYEQIIVEDACTATSAEAHAHTCKATFPRISLVRTTTDVLAAAA